MGLFSSSKSSSSTTNNYDLRDMSTNQNFENVGKILEGNAIDASTTTTNYNFGTGDKAISDLGNILATQAEQSVQVQKTTTNEIVNSLQSTAKTNTVMISITALAAVLGGTYFMTKRRR
jgi:hypothetical protein